MVHIRTMRRFVRIFWNDRVSNVIQDCSCGKPIDVDVCWIGESLDVAEEQSDEAFHLHLNKAFIEEYNLRKAEDSGARVRRRVRPEPLPETLEA